jgi:biotin operon repressor
MSQDLPDLPEGQRELLALLPTEQSLAEIAETLGLTKSGVESRKTRLNEREGYEVYYENGEWQYDAPTGEDDPDTLTKREAYIYKSLPESTATLAEDLDVAERVVEAHLDTIAEKGWSVESDDAGNYLGTDVQQLRSSEHKSQRTRQANEWWQTRHDYLVHEFQQLDWPQADQQPTPDHEDWVTHLTDLHAGDRVRREDGRVVYDTDDIPDVIDHVTRRSLALADKHGSEYDTAHLLWGGDFVTGEGVYEGQHEHLEAWLDQQVDLLHDPLKRQLKTFAHEFDTLQVVAMIGNHGKIRASGVTGRVNADLLLYKSLRNTIAALVEEGVEWADRINFLLGEARAYRNFPLRGGDLRGHLRHGQNRKPQAETSARELDWKNTLIDHDFDLAYIGHHHVSGRIPWSGPPVFVSGSPKPGGEFVDEIGGTRTAVENREIAHVHGVSDDGLTGSFPIDTRHYDR